MKAFPWKEDTTEDEHFLYEFRLLELCEYVYTSICNLYSVLKCKKKKKNPNELFKNDFW